MGGSQACRIPGCPGEYVEELHLHATRRGGEIVVLDDVPMLICDFCGDILLTAETVERLERLAHDPPPSTRMIPLHRYAEDTERREAGPTNAHAVAD